MIMLMMMVIPKSLEDKMHVKIDFRIMHELLVMSNVVLHLLRQISC